MNLIKRGIVVSVATAGLIAGSAGLASADTGHDDGDNTNFENNSLIESVLNNNAVSDNLNGNLSGNNVVISDVLGGGLLD